MLIILVLLIRCWLISEKRRKCINIAACDTMQTGSVPYYINTMQQFTEIPPRSGTGFILEKGQKLKVIDVKGEQVSDFICFNLQDKSEYLSSGRTLDYEETIFLTKGNEFYSNRSNVMFEMV